MADRGTDHGWVAFNLSSHLVHYLSSKLLITISDSSGLRVYSGVVEQEAPAWLILQWADIALLGLGRCSQLTVFFEEGLFRRFLLMGVWSLQSPCRGLMNHFCASSLAAPWLILENWALHLPSLLVETFSILQDETLEGPKVTWFQCQSHMTHIKSTAIVQGSFAMRSSLWDHCLITCLLSFALPFKELANQLLGMIASFLK